ncbi:hypothetical protein [Bacillus massiliglaciei]|uniref:hypothetical protein n=1 Tax=Bacillus massiliglaciei TaxID=1816693 RepID=UPI000DA61BC5|nr:hypothetical protein [Bacillus massiliglaciei]
MSNSEKAQQLYLDCENTNPEENMLMPYRLFSPQGRSMYFPFILGRLVNEYAKNEYTDDWIPYVREAFYLSAGEKALWSEYKSAIYKLEKKGYLETKMENNVNFIRIHEDASALYESDNYRPAGDKESADLNE